MKTHHLSTYSPRGHGICYIHTISALPSSAKGQKTGQCQGIAENRLKRMPGLSLSVMLTLALAVTCLPLAGCDRHKEQAKPETPKFRVLASVYPLADIARQVVGER